MSKMNPARVTLSRPALGHVDIGLGEWRLRRDFLLPWNDRKGQRYHRWLCECLPALQAQTPVHIAVENMPARRILGRRVAFHHFSRPEELARFPYLVLDTTHWGTFGVDPTGVYAEQRERTVHVHLSNYDGREHRLPFKGDLNLRGLLRTMAADSFAGLVVVEVDPWAVAEGDWSLAHIEGTLAETVREVRLQFYPSHSQAAQTHTRCASSLDRAA